MAKKALLSSPSNVNVQRARLKFVNKYLCLIYIMILFGCRSGSSVPGDKKPQNGSSGPLPALHDLSNSMPHKSFRNVIKNKGGIPVTELLNTSTDRAINICLKFHVKIKF